jgi:hypothetical protein
MSSPPTQRVLDKARKDAWLRARGAILPSLTDFLRKDLPCTWIKATDLFDESTLPDGVSKISFMRAICMPPDLEVLGGGIYFESDNEDHA